MRNIFVFTLILFFNANVFAKNEKHIFKPEIGTFTLEFPGNPACKSVVIDQLKPPIGMIVCTFANVKDQLFYSVVYYDNHTKSESISEYENLRNALTGMLTKSQSELIYESEITINGRTALESLSKEKNDLVLVSRFLFIDKSLVLIQIGGWRGRLMPEDVSAFLDSLRITSKK